MWRIASAGVPRVEFKRGVVTVDPAHAAAAWSPMRTHSQQRLTHPPNWRPARGGGTAAGYVKGLKEAGWR